MKSLLRDPGQDRVVGIVLLVAGALLFWRTFSFRTVDWDPLGLAFWPRIVLGLMMAAGLYLTVLGRLDEGPFRPLESKAFLILVGLALYALLLEPLGFLVATPLYVAGFHLALGGVSRRTLLEAVISAAAGTFLIWWIFQDLLLVQFPEGLLAEDL